MLTVEELTLGIAAAMTVALAALMVIVVTGIRHEEREVTMTRSRAPGLAAWLTRKVVGLYVKKTDPEPGPDTGPERQLRQYERSS
jgi:hypothetical protein